MKRGSRSTEWDRLGAGCAILRAAPQETQELIQVQSHVGRALQEALYVSVKPQKSSADIGGGKRERKKIKKKKQREEKKIKVWDGGA